jgi:VanZ family protein
VPRKINTALQLVWAFRLAFTICALAIVLLATLPGSYDPVHAWDKGKHFTAFFTLTVLAVFSFPKSRPVLLGAALSIFGAAIEGVQALPFIHRDCSLGDWLADTLAVIFVLCLAILLGFADAWRRYLKTNIGS